MSLPDWNEVTNSFSKTSRLLINKINTRNTAHIRDTELDTLVTKFKAIEKNVRSFQNQTSKYRTSINKFVNTTIDIGASLQSIATLGEQEFSGNDIQAIDMHSRAETLIHSSEEVQESVEESSSSIEEFTGERIKAILRQFKVVNKRINEMQQVRLSMASNQRDSDALNHKDNNLTAREHRKKFEVQKKLEEHKLQYDSIVSTMKTELPLVIEYASDIMIKMSVSLYYCQLHIFHELYNVVQKCTSDDVPSNLRFSEIMKSLKDKQDVTVESVSQLEITHFTRAVFPINASTTSTRNFSFEKQKQLTAVPDDDKEKIREDEEEPETPRPSLETEKNLEIVIANFDFQTNEPGDLCFFTGEYIRVLKRNKSGWWEGEKMSDHSKGVFPYNYVKSMNN
ncbi:unnamed protein product [Ambrosiozyma monospora]|uniref:Unnamed protein product n=1 Tax=Ambrosiozyma monospora TaxID=43982 RepID=A0ACB5SYG5_AMBMO|nr:unnamed protein product [Ambrosiozyma monospora]